MSKNRWTKEQNQAITARDKDVLVSAAAGSGKTAVLVERIIKRITTDKPPIDIDRMLVVTFTKAAATEMSQRIGISLSKKVAELGEEIRKYPENLEIKMDNIHLQNQLTLLNRADIKTIHAFCLQVIKEYYHVIDIDPAFKTADTSEIALLQQEVMEEYFEELYELGDLEFLRLLESYGEDTKDQKLKSMLLDLVGFSNGFPDPYSALDNIVEKYKSDNNSDINKISWVISIQSVLVEKIRMATENLNNACKILNDDVYGSKERADIIRNEQVSMNMFLNLVEDNVDYEKWYNMANSITFEKVLGGKADFKEERDKIKAYRDIAKENFKYIKEKYLAYTLETQKKIMTNLHEVVRELVRITKGYMERFAEAKKQRMIIDFNDYEHFALKILVEKDSVLENIVPTKYALEIQKRYDEIMIDEYQDSNIVQEMILSSVSRGNNRFIVGDVKQSIYSFRLAMPELFAGKLNDANENQHKILMTQNFRSRENILNGINFIFSQIMSVEFGDVDYNEKVALYPPDKPEMIYPKFEDNINVNCQNEVILIEKETTENLEFDDEDDGQDILEDLDKYELEISAIVTKINQLMADKTCIYDNELKKYRLIEYSDIAIITRSIKNISGAVDTILTREGIPYYIESSLSYFDVMEVDTVLNLLRIIDNPKQDIPLISVLRSPIYNVSPEELLKIRNNKKDETFYEALIDYSDFTVENEDGVENKNEFEYSLELFDKIQKLLVDIKNYREKSKDLSLFELISYIYDYSGYFDYVGVGDGGNLRQGNLRLLLQKAHNYEGGVYQGLFYFIRYIEDMKVAQSDESSAKDEGSIGKALRIMTIHKSKGLEFPIVFLAMTGKNINFMDSYGSMVLHREWGIATKFIDLEKRSIYKPISHTIVSNAIKEDTFSEEIRVLYVALTRAREKLIIIGCVDSIEKSLEKWSKVASNNEPKLPLESLKKSKNYLDFIVPSLLRHPDIHKFGGEMSFGIKHYGNISAFKDGLKKWQVSTWDFSGYSKLQVLEPFKVKKEKLLAKEITFENWNENIIHEECLDEVEKLFSWEYPFNHSTKIQGKTTISEMKRRFLEDEDNSVNDYYNNDNLEFPKDDENSKKINGNLAGTILHKVMELLDFKSNYTKEDLQDFINNLVENNILDENEKNSIRIMELYNFIQSDICKRMQNADNIEKEHVFSMLLSPKEAFVAEDEVDYGDDKILVNGMIDCHFTENGRVVLLDYKSDRLKSEDEFVKRYSVQLKMYQSALEKALDRKVDEIVIYSFALGKEIYID